MGSYAGGHNARGPHTNRSKNNHEEPKQKRRLGTASNEITGGLQLVCGRPTLALSSALVPQTPIKPIITVQPVLSKHLKDNQNLLA